jgi:hypothetical protein
MLAIGVHSLGKGSLLKKVMLAAALGVLVFSLSGCFFMRTLTYNKDKVKPGGVYTAKITLGHDQNSPDEYPFFFVITEDNSKPTDKGEFDSKSVFSGPVALTHTDQSQNISQYGTQGCQIAGGPKRGPGGISGRNIVTTNSPFDSSGNAAKYILAKVPIRMLKDAPGGDAVLIWMGTWMDDGDGVAEDPGGSDDDYTCQPAYTSYIVEKGGPPAPKFSMPKF